MVSLHFRGVKAQNLMGKPHVIAVPYPAQGHVIPTMELALCLVKQGIRVTFVNTVFVHKRIVQSLSCTEDMPELINLVSIPDGLEACGDRNDLGKLTESLFQVMPGKLEALIDNINAAGDDKITCLIADENMGWALDVAEKMGIRALAFWPACAALLALQFNIPKLIDDGIIDSTGNPLKQHKVQLSPGMPEMDPAQFAWACIGDENTRKIIFKVMENNNRLSKKADMVVCNTNNLLEKATLNEFPEILPIGPLLASNRLGKAIGSFWSEDSDCLAWLDEQPPRSVVYVSFGSFTIFDQIQFNELAMGLEQTNRPFLWVVRPDSTEQKDNDDDHRRRIVGAGGHGRVVSWAPQQEVLKHPSVACFLSHCGWNSTMEGISNGLPFLCWPYFADQFLNQTYICDIWEVGLGFNRNENGIIESGEIKNKIDQLLSNDSKFRARAMELKSSIIENVKDGSTSCKNFNNLINWIKDQKKSDNHCREN